MPDKKKYNLDDILAEYDKKTVPNQMPSIGTSSTANKSTHQRPAAQAQQRPAAQVQQRPDPQAQQRPAAQAQQRPATQAQQRPAAQVQQRPAAQAQQRPDPQAQQRPVPQAQQKPAAQAQQRPAAQAQQKPAAQAQQKPAPQAQQKPAAQAQQRPAAQAQQKPAAQAQQKPASQAQQKPAAQAQQKPVAQAQQKTAASVRSKAASQSNSDRSHNTEEIRIRHDSPLKLKIEQYKFLFKQLVKRDFTGRYKRTVLGVLWSMLSPMFTFAAQALVFSVILGRKDNHFISYLIIGNVIFHYFTDAANSGMSALASNGGIISKLNVPKSIFILSKNVSCLYNFALKLIIMFIIVAIDKITFTPLFFSLIIPIILLTAFNVGLGYILSTWFVFYKDTQYLFGIFTQVLMYLSAIFYSIGRFPENMQKLFYLNPIYCYITYFRMVIIDNTLPDARFHIACIFYAVIVLIIGTSMYKKNSNKFIYYF